MNSTHRTDQFYRMNFTGLTVTDSSLIINKF